MSCILLSDSIGAYGEDSRSSPAFLISDAVNVRVIPLCAAGSPMGKFQNAPHYNISLCDQKIAINFLRGINNDVDTLIVFGGVNDWIYNAEDALTNYQMALCDIGLYGHQLGIDNIVFVSPLTVRMTDPNAPDPELNVNNNLHLSQFRAKCLEASQILAWHQKPVHYVDGLSLMTNDPANFHTDGLHPSLQGRQMWVSNLISNLQTAGIFPASY